MVRLERTFTPDRQRAAAYDRAFRSVLRRIAKARLPVSVYKPCDIRGEAATELSAALYEAWGRALGRQLPPAAKFVVGGDVRESTPPFLAALVEGLCQAGLDVVDLGLLPTPMIYYAKRRLHADGCAIVTASHNPATINGLKWMLGDRPPTPDDVAALGAVSSQSPECRAMGQGQGEGNGDDRTRRRPAHARHLLRLRGLPARNICRIADGPAAHRARSHVRLLGGKGETLSARHFSAMYFLDHPRRGRCPFRRTHARLFAPAAN